MTKRFPLIGSLAATAALTLGLLAGCAGPSTADESASTEPAATEQTAATEASTEEAATEPAVAKDTFVYGVSDDPGNTLNYFTTDDRVGMSVIKAIDEPLFTIASDGTYHFYAAEQFDVSDDGLTYTVTMKDGAQWSDGEALTADDVVFTYEKYMELDESGLLQVGGENIEVKKVDDNTVEFVLPSPVASMPENISTVTLIPEHVFKDADNLDMSMLNDTIVGCGPYMFKEYKAGESITLEANPYYMNGTANIPTVVYRIITNDDTAKAALQKGEIDALICLPSQLDGLDEFTITPYSEGRVAYVRLNRVSPNMQDKDFRTGVLTALNKEEIMTAAYGSLDYVTISDSFLPADNAFYTDNVEKYAQDLEKAKSLVAGGPTKLSICYIGTDAAQTAQAQVIQAELKQVGIDVELQGLDQAAYMASAYDNEDTTYDMYLGGYIMTIDPDGFKGMFGTGQMINYASDELDGLFEEGMTTTDEIERVKIYDEAQKVVSEEALFYPFGTNLRILVTNPALEGLQEAGFAPIYTFEDMSKLFYMTD